MKCTAMTCVGSLSEEEYEAARRLCMEAEESPLGSACTHIGSTYICCSCTTPGEYVVDVVRPASSPYYSRVICLDAARSGGGAEEAEPINPLAVMDLEPPFGVYRSKWRPPKPKPREPWEEPLLEPSEMVAAVLASLALAVFLIIVVLGGL